MNSLNDRSASTNDRPGNRSIASEKRVTPQPDYHVSDETFIECVMPHLLGLVVKRGISVSGGVVGQVQDSWRPLFWTGSEEPQAIQLASEAIGNDPSDGNKVASSQTYAAIAVPCEPVSEWLSDAPGCDASASSSSRPIQLIDTTEEVLPGLTNCALVFSFDGNPADACLLGTLAVTLGRYLTLNQARQSNARRLWQVLTMLECAAKWQQLEEDAALLNSIAECACEVLDCERATIFLWDKPRRRLIGRPAIGVEGGVLDVEDNAGIVGEVLQSGQPRWWSAGGTDGGRVNRRIDQAQNFETRSLLAVPMVNLRGQIIGVFEAINANDGDHRDESFDAADVRTLMELASHAELAIQSQRTRTDLTQTRDRLVEQAASSNPLIGEHPTIAELRENATKVASTGLSVLILGRNGTGKEVLAQHIHYHSDRRTGPFVAVNCAALVESLLESELFGHEKGAFTDASETRIGKFELANGGTLFLDEVGDMSPGGQAKLLRVLEERVVVRVGGSQTIPVDVRVIAATNQPLQELIAAKRFREDLFFRLNVVSLTLPPLAARGDDVLLLSNHFIEHFCQQIGRAVPKLDRSAQRLIQSHAWPGNIRELRNTMERLCYLTSGAVATASDLMLQPSVATRENSTGEMGMPYGFSNSNADEVLCLNDATKHFQIEHIQRAIDATRGNMTSAAAKLGLHRSNLYRKMRQLEMPTSGE